jgi:hypothetical protein
MDEEIFEDDVPRDNQITKSKKVDLSVHLANTRRNMAYGIVGVTLLLYCVATGFAIVGGLQLDTFVQIVATLSPLQALAAATVGFFFGSHREGN